MPKFLKLLLLLCFAGFLYIIPPVNAQHFQAVNPTGLPYAIVIDSVDVLSHSLSIDDEIAVFDDTLCVGKLVISDESTYPLALTAWKNSQGLGLPGYFPGNEMIFKIWINSLQYEVVSNAVFSIGDGTFEGSTYSQLYLEYSGIIPPFAPLLDLPLDGHLAHDSSVFFRWLHAEDWNTEESILYKLQISAEENFSTIFESTLLNDTTLFVDTFSVNQTYYWRCLVEDEAGLTNLSQTREIVIDVDNPLSPFDLISPSNNDSFLFETINSFEFRWNECLSNDTNSTVNYSLFNNISSSSPEVTDTSLVVTNISGTNLTIDYYQHLNEINVNHRLEITWLVTAYQNSDSLRSSQTNFFTIIPTSHINDPDNYSNIVSFEILNIFPNPSNSFVVIESQIRKSGLYKIAIYDVLGRQIEIINNGFLNSGNSRFTWSNKTSGTYIVMIANSKKYIQQKKIIILQ